MPNLLNEFLNKSRSQSEPFAPKDGLREDGDAIKGLRLPVLVDKMSSLSVVINGRAIAIAALVPVVYVFAGESGNQWFYMLAGGIVAALFIGFFMPMLQVLDVNTVCSIPSNAVNDENVLIKFTLSRNWNTGFLSELIPVKWVLIKANLVSHLGRRSVVKPMIVETVGHESWIFAATAPLHRGIYRFESMELWSSFPFGLFWFCRKLNTVRNVFDSNNLGGKPMITVYPRMENVEGNFLYKIRASTDSPMGLISSRVISNAATSSVRSLREFHHGDSPRLIHWPSSARTGKLLVREYEAEGLPGFDLMLNMTAPWKTAEQFELAVSTIYSLMHLGFKLGGAPELYLIPNLDIEPAYMPGFMADMPALPSGLARSSHLLARVIPFVDRLPELALIDLKESSRMALITVRPAKQFDFTATDDEKVLNYSVEIAVVPRNIGDKPNQEVHMPVHELGIANRRVGGNPHGRVIGRIGELNEVVHL